MGHEKAQKAQRAARPARRKGHPATTLCLFERNSNVRIFVPRGALMRRVKATAARFGYAGYFVGRARGGRGRVRVYSFCLHRPSEIAAVLERPQFKWWRWHDLRGSERNAVS